MTGRGEETFITDAKSISFKDVCIFIVPKKLTKARIQTLHTIGKKKGMKIALEQSDQVTHVVTAYDSYQHVEKAIGHIREHQLVVSVDWLTNCFSENKVVNETARFCVSSEVQDNVPMARPGSAIEIGPSNSRTSAEASKYECMKPVTLNYQNVEIVSSLEILEKNAQFRGDETRALAFRRAMCAVKSYNRAIKSIDDVANLTHIGAHASRVIKDILENGSSSEVDDILHSESYQILKLFNGIYGCGPATAKSWFALGLKNIEDIKKAAQDGRISLSSKQQTGLKYYSDLNDPVNKEECQKILKLITSEVHRIQPKANVELVGGQRRGKYSGHDVDVFICAEEDHQTSSLLNRLIARLTDLGLILHIDSHIGYNSLEDIHDGESNNLKNIGRQSRMDNLDKSFTILKCPVCPASQTCLPPSPKRRHVDSLTSYKARRVDIIVTPPSQYFISLLGWTGSKQFNRSLRLYAWKEKNLTISNHAVWSHNSQPPTLMKISSEEEIFRILNIAYLAPDERNH